MALCLGLAYLWANGDFDSAYPTMPTLLFVYGTLRRRPRGSHHPLLRRSRCVGIAWLRGRLYDLGRYPALVLGADPHERVRGELYAVPSTGNHWRRLDAYEECAAGDPRAEYRRERIEVQRHDGKAVTAWCYVYNRSIRGYRRIMPADYRVYQRRRATAAAPQGEKHA